jgi:hypothetical protein
MLLWAAGLIAGGVGLAAFATWLAAQPRPGGANIGAGLLAFLGYYAAAIGVVMLACRLWIGRRARRVVRRTLVDCDVRGVIRAK